MAHPVTALLAAVRMKTMTLRLWFAAVALLAPSSAGADLPSRREASLLSPVPSACVSSPFGPRVLPNRPLAGTFHNGVDMPAPAGEAVRHGQLVNRLRVWGADRRRK